MRSSFNCFIVSLDLMTMPFPNTNLVLTHNHVKE